MNGFEAGRAVSTKNIFEENTQGSDSKSCTLTHFFSFEKHMADKATFNIKNVLQSRREASF